MTVKQFWDKWNGKGIDYDGWYGFQCMDLYHQYDKECIGSKNYAAPAAKDVWNKYDKDFYTRITNTPTGVPQEGDVVIWGTGVGPYGHIAVFYAGDTVNFTSFDQNWPVGTKCHFQVHSYKGVLGWLRPKYLQKDAIIVPEVVKTGQAPTTTPQDTPSNETADIPPENPTVSSPEPNGTDVSGDSLPDTTTPATPADSVDVDSNIPPQSEETPETVPQPAPIQPISIKSLLKRLSDVWKAIISFITRH